MKTARLVCVSLLLSLLAAALFGQRAASPVVQSRLRLSGGVGVVYICGNDGKGSARVVLQPLEGKSYELVLPPEIYRSVGGVQKIAGKWMNVEGDLNAGGAFISVRYLTEAKEDDRPDAFRDRPSSPYAKASPLTLAPGAKPYVTILAKFKDVPAEPHPKAWYEGLIKNDTPGLNPYFKEQSYGNISLDGSAVVNWVALPKSRADYTTATGIGVKDEDVVKDAIAAAASQVDFRNYYGINVIVNASVGVIGGTGGQMTYTLNGVTRSWGRTYDNPGDGMFGLLAHEMGHTLGFDHSSGPYATPYDSDWDQMSRGTNWNYRGTYGPYPVHTIAYHRDFAGWIPRSRILYPTPGTDQTVRLERLTQPTASGYLMAKVFLGGSATHYLTVESRKFVGDYDHTGVLPAECVLMHDVDELRMTPDPYGPNLVDGRHAEVLDATKNNDPNDEGAMWRVGESYKDATNGVTVTIVASDASSFTVRLQVDPKAAWPDKVLNTLNVGGSSLRSAIVYANLFPGSTIKFAVPPTDAGVVAGVPTVKPLTPLPAFTAAVTFDATMQTGSTGPTRFMVDGASVGTWGDGLQVRAAGVKIKGFAVGGFPWSGVSVSGAANASIENCALGTNASGTVARPNQTGLDVRGASTNGVMRTSVLSGNTWCGVFLTDPGSDGWTFAGNKIGTNAAGTAKLPNQGSGIYFAKGVKNALVGGKTVADRNVISGNASYGILGTDANTSGMVVIGNYIGLDATGKVALGNVYAGVGVGNGASAFRIGGVTAAERNVVSGNGSGVSAFGAKNCVVQGNTLGLDATGAYALGNSGDGVSFSSGASDGIASGNLSSGNTGSGIGVYDKGTDRAMVQGNLTGVNAAGTVALPNGWAGINVSNGAATATITGNLASGNKSIGIQLYKATSCVVKGNTVGLNAAGSAALGNGGDGIGLGGGTSLCTIGGADAASRNWIGACNGNGIGIYDAGSNGNKIQGNFVGFDTAGTKAMGIAYGGISVGNGAQSNVVSGNVVGNTLGNGIGLWGAGTSNNSVTANVVGLNPAGLLPFGNKYAGISISGGAKNNQIGGATTALANRIGANDGGVSIGDAGTTGNVVQGNVIGYAADGVTLRANGWGGVSIYGGASSNQVLSNTIVGFTGCGISLQATGTTGNLVLSNTVGGNASLGVLNTGWGGIGVWGGASNNTIGSLGKGNLVVGSNYGIYVNDAATLGNSLCGNRLLKPSFHAIDLGGDGVDANDALDADTGPNHRQNAPELTKGAVVGGKLQLGVKLAARKNVRYRIDVYSATLTGPNGWAVADVHLGSFEVDGSALGTIQTTLAVTVSGYVCATATDLGTMDTGELSAAIKL